MDRVLRRLYCRVVADLASGDSRLMASSVQSKVVGAGEGAVAELTLERFGAGVFTKVSC